MTLPVPTSVVAVDDGAWSAMLRTAKLLAASSIVPKAYRNKPDDIMAVGLSAHALGVPLTLNTLAQFFVADGKVEPMAQITIAVAASRGHLIWPIEISPTRAVVGARRRGSAKVLQFAWTIDQAQRAGLLDEWYEEWYTGSDNRNHLRRWVLGSTPEPPAWVTRLINGGETPKRRDSWHRFPEDMLYAKATKRAAKAVAGDALLGLVDLWVDDVEPTQDPPTWPDEVLDADEVLDSDGAAGGQGSEVPDNESTPGAAAGYPNPGERGVATQPILCAHADTNGDGAHWRRPDEPCTYSRDDASVRHGDDSTGDASELAQAKAALQAQLDDLGEWRQKAAVVWRRRQIAHLSAESFGLDDVAAANQVLDDIIAERDATWKRRCIHVNAVMADVGVRGDIARHALIARATDDQTESSARLSGEQFQAILAVCADLAVIRPDPTRVVREGQVPAP